MKISLDANMVRSALEIAPAKDIRYYLNGIYIDAENKSLVSTDGHCIYMAKSVETFEESLILEKFTVPKNVEIVEIEHFKDNRYVATLISTKGTSEIVVKSIDGKYVNYQAALVNMRDSDRKAIKNIGFNLTKLSTIAKIFKNACFDFTGGDGIVYITTMSRIDEMVAVMPHRIDSNLESFSK